MYKVNTVERIPKQRQFSQICWKYIHRRPILFKWVGPLVLLLKAYHIETWNSKNVQSLIIMGEDRSFGNTHIKTNRYEPMFNWYFKLSFNDV